MGKVAILSPLIVPSAVGNDVIGMYKALKSVKVEVRVFSEMCSVNSTNPDFVNLTHINSYLTEKDIVLYHHSIGWSKGIKLLRNLQCVKVIKYHNVTPPEFFTGINSDYELACLQGRKQLQDLVKMRCRLYISDSNYNRAELIREGAPEDQSIVIPPFHHIDRLLNIDPDQVVLKKYSDDSVNILMIGRLAPNKGHIEAINSFFALQTLLPESRLIIVGNVDPSLSIYNRRIRNMIRILGLAGRVIITGEVSDSELKAYYLVSHCFLTTSKHEGFCVPIVEAMSMKIPIVAYGSSAIPETAGNAGIILGNCEPLSLAHTVDSIIKSSNLQNELKKKGYERYKEFFDDAVIEGLFIEAISELLH